MPELPDVEIFKRYLDATSLHQQIEKVQVHHSRILSGVNQKTLQNFLTGEKFEKTSRHGKHLFAKIGGGWLRLHFGMTGYLKYYKNETQKPWHTRMHIRFCNDFQLAYVNQRLLGRVGWVEKPEDFISRKRLGPDALNDTDCHRFKKLLAGRKGFLKSALMNQKVIAGLGNVYTDEILFQARVAPDKPVEDVSAKEFAALFKSMQTVLCKAVEAKANPEQFPKRFITPHRSKDGRCPRCGRKLEKITVAGRSGYFCPRCQV